MGARSAVTPGLCRDCLADQPGTKPRCTQCGSPRLIRHRALEALHIAHVDCDAFFATVEKRDNPALRDRPVLVGGETRGVVAAACYIARTYGVHSAMPMFEAKRLCPDAVIVRPNMAKYVARSDARCAARCSRSRHWSSRCRSTKHFSTSPAPNALHGAIRPKRSRASRSRSSATSASPSRSACPATSSSPRSPPISTSRVALPCSAKATALP